MSKYVLSIDQGTTGTTALIIDAKNHAILAKANIEYPQIYPSPGEVEHNLHDIWHSVEAAINAAIKQSNIKSNQISAIGITNQRETTCAFDKDMSPLTNAIVWQDRRTKTFCEENKERYAPLTKLTGLPLDPYFSGTKMRWMLQNVPAVVQALKAKTLHFGTVDTFLLYKLTQGQSYKTEPSNASRTLLLNINTGKWDDTLLDFFEIPKNCLPEIQDSFSTFGTTKGLGFLPDGIPITCILGDQQAALFGQGGHKAGELKCTYGTGAFILLNTGDKPIYTPDGILTTIAYRHQGKIIYALEGSSYIAGAAVQWLRDGLKIIKKSSDVEALAQQVSNLDSMKNLLLFPFFTGIGTPYWKSEATGTIFGITRDTTDAHIARACLDGMALSINDSIQSIVKNSKDPVKSIKVDGGATANNLLMQTQANFSGLEIIRPKIIETTGYGVALGALIGSNEITFEDIAKLWKEDQKFSPQNDAYFKNKSAQWQNLIKKIYL